VDARAGARCQLLARRDNAVTAVGETPVRTNAELYAQDFYAWTQAQAALLGRTVASLGVADNSRGPLLSRLKGAHQSVIKPRQPVFSFSFIPPCLLGDRPILFYCTILFLENALPRLSLWPRRHPLEQHFFE
jgi:hypothetical protein